MPRRRRASGGMFSSQKGLFLVALGEWEVALWLPS